MGIIIVPVEGNIFAQFVNTNSVTPHIHEMIFKTSVPTAYKTQRVSITRAKKLMLFREIISVYPEKHKPEIFSVDKTDDY
jgi:hypothetical protein